MSLRNALPSLGDLTASEPASLASISVWRNLFAHAEVVDVPRCSSPQVCLPQFLLSSSHDYNRNRHSSLPPASLPRTLGMCRTFSREVVHIPDSQYFTVSRFRDHPFRRP